MSGYLDKVIAVIICFLLLMFVPITIMQMINDMAFYRTMVSETENFLDVVIDTAQFDEEYLFDLYAETARYNTPVTVSVKHYMRILNPRDADGKVSAGYYLVPLGKDNTTGVEYSFQEGDKITITVEAIDYTRGQKLVRQFLGYTSPRYKITNAGRIRNFN